MNCGSRKSWRSIMPLPLPNKSASLFCKFPKTKLTEFDADGTPVYLNVYDLTPINSYLYWAGLGVFHSGVEVHGVEYAFGAHNYPTSGIFKVGPRQCPGFKFRKSIFIGTTHYDPFEVREFFQLESSKYSGNSYHLVSKNCNHFSEDICQKLTGERIPKWVNRLAKMGSICNCILPETIKPTSVRRNCSFECYKSESKTKRLGNSVSSFSSIPRKSAREKEVSISSLFIHSHFEGSQPFKEG